MPPSRNRGICYVCPPSFLTLLEIIARVYVYSQWLNAELKENLKDTMTKGYHQPGHEGTEPSSLLPPHTLPLGRPSAPAPSIQYRASNLDCNSFHTCYYTCFNAILPNHPTLSLSHRVQKTVLYISVSFAVS